MITSDSDLIRLVRIGFDSLENHNPVYETEIGIFNSRDGLSSYGRVAEWFRAQEPVKLYTGYDGQVYPQWRLEVKRAQ